MPVKARLIKKTYKKGIKIPDAVMNDLSVKADKTLPKWNYSICPS